MPSLEEEMMKTSDDQKYIILGLAIFVGAPIVYVTGLVWWMLAQS
jgi:hypothetical protein